MRGLQTPGVGSAISFGSLAQQCDDGAQLTQGRGFAEPRADHEIGAPALFPVRHLLGQNGVEARARHVAPAKHPGLLHETRRADHGDRVAEGFAAGLEQQRYVEHGQPAAVARLLLQERPRRAPDRGVQDGLEARERRRVLEDPLGETPAWLIEGDRDAWLVYVHGKGSEPGELLRMLPAVVALGMPVLAIQYRNDAGAPSIDGDRYHYGATEWADLEAAVQYALDEGARDVVVAAHSMGGGIALSFLERSPLAGHVSALILDAPMLELRRTIDLGIRESALPDVLASPTRTLTGWRAGIDFDEVDYLSRAGDLSVPVLLFHGAEDDIVPVELSREFAAARPDLVTYIEFAGLGHTQSWNGDPAAYERAVSEFLADRLQ